jgi:hypothetical protein
MPKNGHALLDPRYALSATHGFDDAITCDRRPVRQAQDALASQMPSSL